MTQINVSVAVDEAHLDHIFEVAQNLRETGMSVDRVMDRVGVIVGSCEEGKLDALARVEGVDSVEPEREIQIPPPDSNLQ
jgi:hypothetical protein